MKPKATPEKEDFGNKYKNNNYITSRLIDGYFNSVNILLNEIPRPKINSALEIGCGEGYSTARIRSLLPVNVSFEASEFVTRLVPLAKEKNPGIKIIKENVYKTTRKNNSFDLVFLLEVLEHLDYPDIALAELNRISKNFLILGVPKEPLWRILNMLRGKYVKNLGNTKGHLNHWSQRGVINFVTKYYGPVIAVENPIPWTIVLAKKR